MAQIEAKNLVLGYDGKAITEKLNFSVNKGDYLCIVGENGSGKTTLMKTILGLNSPISGSIKYGDGLKEKQIGYLPQQTEIQKDFPASVYEIVISGCLPKCGWRPFYSDELKKLADAQIARLSIRDLTKRCYSELSGGQQQRVLLARALCATQEAILLDEPVTGLDPKVSADMYSLIYDINTSDRITVIMISHDISVALKYATHILHIGHKSFFGTKEEYLKSNFASNFGIKGGDDNA